MDFVNNVCDRVMLMNNGSPIYEEEPGEVVTLIKNEGEMEAMSG